MLTRSIIKADTGGFVGHSAMHPKMLAVARAELDRARAGMLVDAQVSSCGDDLHLAMTHRLGRDARPVHELADQERDLAHSLGEIAAVTSTQRLALMASSAWATRSRTGS